MSRVCTASGEEGERNDTLDALKARFPEIPEEVIATTLTKHSVNLEKCITILSQESDRYLYGGEVESDSPLPVQVQPNPPTPSAPMEPLSITIPPTTTHELPSNYGYGPLSLIPVTRPLTVAIASSTGATNVIEPHMTDRHPSIDSYNQKLVQHQQQRLERVKRELENDMRRLSLIHHEVQRKEEELYNNRVRVADNPTESSVAHLQEETEVLRKEVDHMANEIDRLNDGVSPPLGVISQDQFYRFPPPHNVIRPPPPHNVTRPPPPRNVTRPPPTPPNMMRPRFAPPPAPHLRKSQSFPTESSIPHNPRQPPPYTAGGCPPYPIDGLPHGMPTPHNMPMLPWFPPRGELPLNNLSGEAGSVQSPPRDPSLEGQGWILVPPTDPNHPSLPPTSSANSVVHQPPTQDESEQPWQCRHCTLENHGALNVCEACDMPRR